MRKTKSELLVRGVLLRDVAALKRRVQALEKALWPNDQTAGTTGRPRAARTKTVRERAASNGRRLVEVDEATARRLAIDAFYKAEHAQWIENNPQYAARRRAERTRLNDYLREQGFEPEPDS